MTFKNIFPIRMGDLEFSLIQGGMGVGISLSGLASAVSNEGGLGVIASVCLGQIRCQNKKYSYSEANSIALREEIQEFRRKSNGPLGVNVMTALSDAESLIETTFRENVDVLISGAGIKRDLPDLKKAIGSRTLLVPIVSSARTAQFICEKAWKGYLPDAVIVEGPMAGGHLGYDLFNPKKPLETRHLDNLDFVKNGLEQIVKEVITVTNKYRSEKTIPVIAAGGIYYGGDIKIAHEWGASGVQMASRFVTTHECDAHINFKQAYVDCEEKDLILIKSPVGMNARAINNAFLESVQKGEKMPIRCPYHCLITCVPKESPYCIAEVLLNAQMGKLNKGYAFAGTNAWRSKEIVSVKKLFEDLDREYGDNIGVVKK